MFADYRIARSVVHFYAFPSRTTPQSQRDKTMKRQACQHPDRAVFVTAREPSLDGPKAVLTYNQFFTLS
jgi:hypothetical protein